MRGHDSLIDNATPKDSNMTTITALTTKFLGVKGTVYRLFKDGELIGVYGTKEEAEAAQAALK